MKRHSFILKTQNSFFLSKTYIYYAVIIVILFKPAIVEDISLLDTIFNDITYRNYHSKYIKYCI